MKFEVFGDFGKVDFLFVVLIFAALDHLVRRVTEVLALKYETAYVFKLSYARVSKLGQLPLHVFSSCDSFH